MDNNVPCTALPVSTKSAGGAQIPMEEVASNGHSQGMEGKSCGREEFVGLTFL